MEPESYPAGQLARPQASGRKVIHRCGPPRTPVNWAKFSGKLFRFRNRAAGGRWRNDKEEGIHVEQGQRACPHSLHRLASVAGFVVAGVKMDVALVLVVLGLIAGISLPMERMVLAAVDDHRRCRSSARALDHHIP